MGSNVEYNDWVNLVFLERSHYTLGMFGLILFFGVPILLMIYGGIKLLFKIRYSNRWLNIGSGLIWFVGLLIMVFVGISTGKDFNDEGKIKDQVQIAQRDTLYLTLNKSNVAMSELSFNDDDEDDNYEWDHRGRRRSSRRHRSDYVIGKNGNSKYIVGHARLNIVPSLTDNFELYIIKKARGEDKRSGLIRAKAIEYKFSQNDSLISLDEFFTVAANEKFRVQEVRVLLKVPRNKVIHLDKSLEHFLDDIENVTNTFDGDMVGRRWIMTKEGLECIDCDGIEKEEDKYNHFPEPPAPPALPGVNVNAKDADVKIDKDGIDIKSKDANVKIGKDGIHIDTKENKK